MEDQITIRVYYEDTDAGGIVYHANYLRFFERGRTEFLRRHGIDHNSVRQGQYGEPLLFVVSRMDIAYRRPARLDDVLTVTTSVKSVAGASLVMDQAIWRGTPPASRDAVTIKQADNLLTTATVTVAIITEDGALRRIPGELRHIFNTLVCSTPPSMGTSV